MDEAKESERQRHRWETADAYAYSVVENNAVKNRRPMTLAEEKLWNELRSSKLGITEASSYHRGEW